MKADFWHKKWEDNQIGFHQSDYNSNLVKFWDDFTMGMNKGRVFVPLCGKSKDMLYLAEKGLKVAGVELSKTAVVDFFIENSLDYTQKNNHYSSENIDLFCDDLFKLTNEDISDVHYIYDRASIVALPEEMRLRYSKWLYDMFPKASMFVETFEFDSEVGPPFSISEELLNTYYSEHYDITKIQTIEGSGLHSEHVSSHKSHTFFIRPK